MARAIWINAKDRVITEIDLKGLDQMQAAVEGRIESILNLGRRHYLYANEDGRYKKFPYGFRFAKLDLIGNGFVAAHDEEGESCDAQVTVDFFKKNVEWIDWSGVEITIPQPRVVFVDEDGNQV